jgi:hypothetical protein
MREWCCYGVQRCIFVWFEVSVRAAVSSCLVCCCEQLFGVMTVYSWQLAGQGAQLVGLVMQCFTGVWRLSDGS